MQTGGRIRPGSIRLKDAANFSDGLANVVTGQGTPNDKRVHAAYQHNYLHPIEIDAAYRSSWLMRKGVDLPAYDMTRAWRDWKADTDQIEAIEAEEKRLGLRDKVRRALIMGRLGGGALVLGLADNASDQPLPSKIKAGDLKYVHVMSRYRLIPGPINLDPGNPNFGEPDYFEVAGSNAQGRVHASRVIPFKGRPVSDIDIGNMFAWYWGDSVLATVMEAVKNADTAQGAFASLIEEAKLDVYAIPGLTQMAGKDEYIAGMRTRMQTSQLFKSLYNALLIDAGGEGGKGGEEWTTRQITWAGIPDIIKTYLSIVAAAFEIPATKMLSKSPDGMNATGDSDEANYESMISGRQENDLRPNLERFDKVLVPSATGITDAKALSDITFMFAPLSVMSEKDKAAVAYQKAQTSEIYSNINAMPEEALAEAVQNQLVEDGTYPGLDGFLEAIPEDERFPGKAARAATASEPDPSALQAPGTDNGGKEVGPPSPMAAGSEGSAPRRRAVNDARFVDATPRTLYVSRKLLNADELIRWAKSQGIETTLPADDMHVTVAFSRAPIDWMTVGTDWSGDDKGNLLIRPGGPRTIERMGDGDAVALQFLDDSLAWRHQRIRDAGASWDWPSYQPHVTISWAVPGGFDLSKVEPYQGPLKFGPELFAQVDEDWSSKVTEE